MPKKLSRRQKTLQSRDRAAAELSAVLSMLRVWTLIGAAHPGTLRAIRKIPDRHSPLFRTLIKAWSDDCSEDVAIWRAKILAAIRAEASHNHPVSMATVLGLSRMPSATTDRIIADPDEPPQQLGWNLPA